MYVEAELSSWCWRSGLNVNGAKCRILPLPSVTNTYCREECLGQCCWIRFCGRHKTEESTGAIKLLGNFSRCRRIFLHKVNVKNLYFYFFLLSITGKGRTMCFVILCFRLFQNITELAHIGRSLRSWGYVF